MYVRECVNVCACRWMCVYERARPRVCVYTCARPSLFSCVFFVAIPLAVT